VQWERAWYGVSWLWAGQQGQVQADGTTGQLWASEQRLAAKPRANRPGQRFTARGKWAALPGGGGPPRTGALAVQVPTVEVQQRSLAIYDALAGLEAGR